FSGQYTYTPAEVRELLTTYYGSDVSEVSSEVMALAEAELTETTISNILGGYITPDEKIDLELAIQDLEVEHQDYFEIIRGAFEFGEPYHSGRKAVHKTRALDKLTTIMNRKRSQR
ncbi:hypothetical protein, partial [Salmonella enterica]|uniref:hypothetical protein n=1 Tax=Salmonella enterica TaxID=28901 RepID=UPI000CBEE4E6